MNITFTNTMNNIHVIDIDGKKAGYIELLSDNSKNVSPDEKKDWRVFFYGAYGTFQVNKLNPNWHPGADTISLNQIKANLIKVLNDKPESILKPEEYFPKGYALAHCSNGKIYTIDFEYEDRWTEYVYMGNKQMLFSDVQTLQKRVEELQKKEAERLEYWRSKDGSHTHHYGEVLNIEYKFIPELFDTSYFYCL